MLMQDMYSYLNNKNNIKQNKKKCRLRELALFLLHLSGKTVYDSARYLQGYLYRK